MPNTVKPGTRDVTKPYFRVLYTLFVLLGIYLLVFRKDYSSAMANLGIALAFDPFSQTQPFNQRPLYQKAWLIVHLAAVLTLLLVVLL